MPIYIARREIACENFHSIFLVSYQKFSHHIKCETNPIRRSEPVAGSLRYLYMRGIERLSLFCIELLHINNLGVYNHFCFHNLILIIWSETNIKYVSSYTKRENCVRFLSFIWHSFYTSCDILFEDTSQWNTWKVKFISYGL